MARRPLTNTSATPSSPVWEDTFSPQKPDRLVLRELVLTHTGAADASTIYYVGTSASWSPFTGVMYNDYILASSVGYIEVLLVGGGGGGAGAGNTDSAGGGGGAGGVIHTIMPTYSSMTVTVGGGGSGGNGFSAANGSQGVSTSISQRTGFSTFTSIIAGGGGGGTDGTADSTVYGSSGGATYTGGSTGSGSGGGAGSPAGFNRSGTGGTPNPGTYQTSFPNVGTRGTGFHGFGYTAANTNQILPGLGVTVMGRQLAGGGPGAGWGNPLASAYGAPASVSGSTAGGNGTAGTGAGGGGACNNATTFRAGGSGGSGIAIIRYFNQPLRGVNDAGTTDGAIVRVVISGSSSITVGGSTRTSNYTTSHQYSNGGLGTNATLLNWSIVYVSGSVTASVSSVNSSRAQITVNAGSVGNIIVRATVPSTGMYWDYPVQLLA